MICGFFQAGRQWINSYEIVTINPRHDDRGAELHMTNGKIVYVNDSPGKVIDNVAEARRENEGR